MVINEFPECNTPKNLNIYVKMKIRGLGFGSSSNAGFPTYWLGPVLPVNVSELVTWSIKWE